MGDFIENHKFKISMLTIATLLIWTFAASRSATQAEDKINSRMDSMELKQELIMGQVMSQVESLKVRASDCEKDNETMKGDLREINANIGFIRNSIEKFDKKLDRKLGHASPHD